MGNRDSLKIVGIGQSAAKPRTEERSSTIPRGSTLLTRKWKREAHGYIYMLADPFTGEIKYVGKTSRHLYIRLGEHMQFRKDAANQSLVEWLKKLEITPIVYFKTYPERLLLKAERYLIKYYSIDNRLLNFNHSKNPRIHKIGNRIKHSDETVRKITEATMKTKSIPCYKCSQDGIILSEYDSISHAHRKTGIPIENIYKCIKGERITAGGYKWVRRYSQPTDENQ